MNKVEQIKQVTSEYNLSEDMKTSQAMDMIIDIINAEDDYDIIVMSKNKLVLLSKLLKEVRAVIKGREGKELMSYKLKTQRNTIESLCSENGLNKWVDRCKATLNKQILKTQIKDDVDDEI